MTVALRSLRVAAEMDTGKFVAGAKSLEASSKTAGAAVSSLGVSISQASSKVNGGGGALTALERRFVPGAAAAHNFDKAIVSLGRAIDTGSISMERAEAVLQGLHAKYGLTANAAELMQKGQTDLANTVTNVNARIAANAAGSARLATANDNIADSTRNAAFQQKNLQMQLSDTFQSIALGMPVTQVLLQQGPQIASIYGPGEGGIGRAFKETAAMAATLVARLWPVAAAAAGVYAAYQVLTSNSAAAALEVDSLTKELAKQAVSAGTVSSMIADLATVQATYDKALEATAKAHSSMSAANIANTEAEFNAKKSLLELQLKYQQALIETQKAEIAQKGLALRQEIAGSVNIDLGRAERGGFSDPRIGNFVRLPDDITGLDKTREMIDASPLTDEMKKIRAELTLNELAAGRLQEALGTTFNAAGTEAKTAGGTIKKAATEGVDAWDGLRKVSEGVADQMKEAAQQAEEQVRFFRDLTGGAVSDFFSSIEEGASVWEAFSEAAINALDKIANKLLDDVLDAVFQVNGAGTGGGGVLGGLGDWFGSLFGGSSDPWAGLRMANGGVFSAGRVTAFAKGGAFTNQIVDRPTLFPFAKGAGLMGEAGPEAIMPLRRDASGRLGVSAAIGAFSAANDNRHASGGRTVIEVVLSPDLIATILQQADNNSVRILQQNERNRQDLYMAGGEAA
ncbi:hypothetical protein GOB15_23770 [Sinorhizobium meliloti]|nr:hypothetical protein [Sinorhizobium meliloti]MDW9512861.1 hypothetical protein [Sinorhizobium meliloti]